MDAERNEQLDERLSAYLDDELTGDQRAEVEAWLDGDPGARGRLEELRSTVNAVRGLPRAEASDDLLESLRSRMERQALLDPPPAPARQEETPVSMVAVSRWLSMAAVIALCATTIFFLWPGDEPESTHRSNELARVDEPPAKEPESTTPDQRPPAAETTVDGAYGIKAESGGNGRGESREEMSSRNEFSGRQKTSPTSHIDGAEPGAISGGLAGEERLRENRPAATMGDEESFASSPKPGERRDNVGRQAELDGDDDGAINGVFEADDGLPKKGHEKGIGSDVGSLTPMERALRGRNLVSTDAQSAQTSENTRDFVTIQLVYALSRNERSLEDFADTTRYLDAMDGVDLSPIHEDFKESDEVSSPTESVSGRGFGGYGGGGYGATTNRQLRRRSQASRSLSGSQPAEAETDEKSREGGDKMDAPAPLRSDRTYDALVAEKKAKPLPPEQQDPVELTVTLNDADALDRLLASIRTAPTPPSKLRVITDDGNGETALWGWPDVQPTRPLDVIAGTTTAPAEATDYALMMETRGERLRSPCYARAEEPALSEQFETRGESPRGSNEGTEDKVARELMGSASEGELALGLPQASQPAVVPAPNSSVALDDHSVDAAPTTTQGATAAARPARSAPADDETEQLGRYAKGPETAAAADTTVTRTILLHVKLRTPPSAETRPADAAPASQPAASESAPR